MPIFIPKSDYVLLTPAKAVEQSFGGIVMPASAQEKENRGVVVAVGPGRQLDNGTLTSMPFDPGDLVVYSKQGITELKIEGQDFVVLPADFIFGALVD